MKKDQRMLLAFLAYAMYFLTGATCVVVGSSLPQLAEMYGLKSTRVVLLNSCYAFGRLFTVYLTGRLVERFGPLRVLSAGVILLGAYLFGVPTFHDFHAGMVFACLGGIGMGTQDTVCPVLLSSAFRDRYASSLSAGQALYGLGNFAVPFMVGMMLSGNLPFYYSYYAMCLVAVIILAVTLFARYDHEAARDTGAQEVRPLYTAHTILAYALVVIVCASYCGVTGSVMLYTTSFALSLGMSQSTSAFMLTAFNIGCLTGSMAFIWILSKVTERATLVINLSAAFIAISAMLLVDRIAMYFIGLFSAGFFLGVLFSVIVSIATRIGYRHISRASSVVAMAGGVSDTMTPVITGVLIGWWGIGISFKYAILMLLICLAASLALRAITSEKIRPGGVS